MGAYVFQNALSEYLRPKRVVIWVLVAICVFAAAKLFANVSPNMSAGDKYSMLSSLLLFRLLPLASAIFSSGVLSQEIEQKTIVYLLTRPVPRPQFLIFRLLASVVAVIVVSIMAALAISFAIYGPAALSNNLLSRDIVALAVGAMAYGSLFVLISLLINRAMIVSLLFAFAWETSVPSMPGSIYLLSISSYLTAIAQRPSAGSERGNPLKALASSLGGNTLTADQGWAVIIGITLFCAVFGAWWFTRSEYLPREDAE
ncbi:MAG: type transport system permease protein [Fimbriimonadaceae bacterium]|jgi:ABC-2 type transport system permease protein|nr:type transport system permease protein [Fimbriimonadaceae bacterium]